MRSWAILVLLTCLPGCSSLGSFFEKVDDHCIAGKLTPEGARLLNENFEAVNWHSDYVERYGGAAQNDRILGRHCSEASKDASGALSEASE